MATISIKNKSIDFPLHKQMGLFSELMCLKEIVSKNIGIKNAIFHGLVLILINKTFY